jgi:hypothetical protein
MRLLLLPVLAAFQVLLFAQPVLHSNEMAPPGTVAYMRFLGNMAAVDTTIQGSGVTWDFSSMTPHATEPQFIMAIVDPATTPNGASFPTANYAWWEQPNNFYRYFNLTPNLMERVGSYTNSTYTFADPQVEYVFPLTYGTTNTDPWYGVFDGGQYQLNCVGHGTLIVPGATLTDMLMVRVKLTNSTQTIWMYIWYSSVDGMVRLQYSRHPLANFGLYYDGIAMAIHEHTAFQTTILGNPVSDQLNFTMGTDAGLLNYTVVSATGALVRAGKISGVAGAVTSIDLAGAGAGVYLLDLRKEGTQQRETLRFVKE